jgi:Zn-dependent M28 family amino/carboxypeptidase
MDMIAGRNTDAAAADAHTSLVVQTSLNPFNSDHVPFLDAGIPTVLTIEGADGANVRVHTELDTREPCDVDLALEILRMNVAFVAQVLDAA